MRGEQALPAVQFLVALIDNDQVISLRITCAFASWLATAGLRLQGTKHPR